MALQESSLIIGATGTLGRQILSLCQGGACESTRSPATQLGDIIRARRASPLAHDDLLDALLQMRDADGGQMSAAQLRDEMMRLVLAGHETTAIALSWACFLLSQHPGVEAQLIQELRTILDAKTPTPDDL